MRLFTSTRNLAVMLLTLLISSLVWVAMPANLVKAGAISVTTTADEYNTNGNCSLREAITAANLNIAVDGCPAGNGTDTIYLPAGQYNLSITGSGEDGNLTGDFDIYSNLHIQGSGAGLTVIDGMWIDRVFHIYGYPSVEISNITISEGHSGFAAGGVILLYQGSLTLTNSEVLYAAGNGGIYSTGSSTLAIDNSRIEENMGSGLILAVGTTTTIRNSTLRYNVSDLSSGGGISNGGALTITNSTLSGNISYNDGGGIYNFGVAHLYNVTITGNRSDTDQNNVGDGGGIQNSKSGLLTIRNSIIAHNEDNSLLGGMRPDCAGTQTSEGHNLILVTTDCTITGDTTGNIYGQSPLLGPLQDNGGLTQTHALLAGSPASNAGEPTGCQDETGNELGTDQRGFARNGICDIGAYEYNSAGTPTATPPVPNPGLFLPLIMNNPLVPASTFTPTPSLTATFTLTPTPTMTRTPTPTASKTPTATEQDTPAGVTPTAIEGYGYINIVDFAYEPGLVTIHRNAIVTWENTSPTDHTVTSDTGVFDSGNLAPTAKFQYQFTSTGVFPYHCILYPSMTGTVIVVP